MYTDFSTGDKTSFDQTDVTDAVLQHDAVPETIMTDPDPVSQPQAEAQLDVQVASSSEVEDMEEAGTDGTSEEVVKKEDAKKLDDDSLRPKSQNKEPLKEYFCKVCKAKCSGDAIYQQHLQGNRHRKNLANAKIGAPIIRNIKKKGKKVARLTAKLSGVEEALLGLEYLIEHQKEDETIEERYICDLCEAKCDPRTVIFHVTGTKHRMAYLKKHHPESLSEIAARREAEIKRSVLSSKLAEIAKEVEKEHGRKPIQVKVELDPFYNPYHQRLEAAATQKRMMLMDEGLVPPQKLQRFEGGPMGGGRGRARGRGGFPVRGGRGVGRFADRGRGGGGGRGRGGPPRDGRGVRSHGGQPSRAPLLGPGPSPLLMPPEEIFEPDIGMRGMPPPPDIGMRGMPPPRRGDLRGFMGPDPGPRGGGRFDERDPYLDDYYPPPPPPPSRSAASIQDRMMSESLGEGRFGGGHAGRRPERYFDERRYEEDRYGGPSRDVPGYGMEPDRYTRDDGRHGTQEGGRSGNLQSLLQDLSKCLVSTEDDAAMALQVSNALTQSLLNYRLRNAPPELLDIAGPNTALSSLMSSSQGDGRGGIGPRGSDGGYYHDDDYGKPRRGLLPHPV